jgi:toxin-antitoxin system PIN domain toxin
LVDANLLIYAGVSSVREHERARSWLDARLSEQERVGIPWHSLLAYLRITTKRGAFAHPQSTEAAWSQIREWLRQPPVWIPQPTERHADVLENLLIEARASGNLISDAHLAALAIEHGLTLCSADSDFARFPKLKWYDPLTGRRISH